MPWRKPWELKPFNPRAVAEGGISLSDMPRRRISATGSPALFKVVSMVLLSTDKGGDGKRYIYSTYDMRAYLTGRYGHPKRFPGTATKADLASVKGVTAFGFYHVDVWDGSKCAGHDGGFGNAKVQDILVWVAP